jgi:uncharacterized protein YecE (DUF72 family)
MDAVRPLRDSGQLGALLAQFPWSFKPGDAERDLIRRIPEALGDVPGVVEFRNREWIVPPTMDLLRDLGLGFCCVDEPRLRGLVPPVAEVTSSTGYVRFHGRNAAKWWKHEHAYERYDYLYSNSELQEWEPKIRAIAERATRTFVYFNNHYEGKAPRNAEMMASLLQLSLPGAGAPE